VERNQKKETDLRTDEKNPPSMMNKVTVKKGKTAEFNTSKE